jgi:hypothetical protein
MQSKNINKISVGNGNCYMAIHGQVKKTASGSVDITLPDTSFVFSISFWIFNSENMLSFELKFVL